MRLSNRVPIHTHLNPLPTPFHLFPLYPLQPMQKCHIHTHPPTQKYAPSRPINPKKLYHPSQLMEKCLTSPQLPPVTPTYPKSCPINLRPPKKWFNNLHLLIYLKLENLPLSIHMTVWLRGHEGSHTRNVISTFSQSM